MADCLLHRGPDAGGVWAEGPVAFGHRRLKIIDLTEGGAQPMHTPDGRFVIVYNGEIYNFKALRRELEQQGVRFRSTSDTEVLLQLYARAGRAMLERLNGIFAFAIWDTYQRKLFAARDQLGVKPFYYILCPDHLLFASEIKAFLETDWTAEADEQRIAEYLLFGDVAGAHTLFKGVKRLPPGAWMEYQPGQALKIGRYFDVARVGERAMLSKPEAVEAVQDVLERAVERQMISDVPVGSMCSGGLDSSGLTALSAQHLAGLNTFCIRIPDPNYDETAHSRRVSTYYGTDHHELTCGNEEVASLLSTAIWLHDEPLKHANSIPIFLISRLAKESVTVLLSGEGADEIFGGYTVHRRAAMVDALSRWCPRSLLKGGEQAAAMMGRRGARQVMQAAGMEYPAQRLVWMRAETDPGLVEALMPDVKIDLSARIAFAEAAWQGAHGDPAQAAMLYDQQTYLNTLLDRQDKMCMGASIESRVPFLDVDVVALVNQLGRRHKLRDGISKAVLRDALADRLPPSISRRKKFAFGIPLGRYFGENGPLVSLVDHVCDGEVVRHGILNVIFLRRIVQAAGMGDYTVMYLMWNVLNLELWWNLFISKQQCPDLTQLPAYRFLSSAL
jgi:asparagine synthase (glutamine-hydrolysing)